MIFESRQKKVLDLFTVCDSDITEKTENITKIKQKLLNNFKNFLAVSS